MKNIILVFAFLFLSSAAFAGGIVGLWKTIDDETGKPKSIISVYEEGGMLFGKILFTYNDDGAPAIVPDGKKFVCDPTKLSKIDNKPYCGLIVLKDLKPAKNPAKYEKGQITDPKKGADAVYRADIELQKDGTLKVRGMLGGGLLKALGRNQIWLPATAEDLPEGFIY